jgi:hypothetical protein
VSTREAPTDREASVASDRPVSMSQRRTVPSRLADASSARIGSVAAGTSKSVVRSDSMGVFAGARTLLGAQ